jgi:D-psicose/D-tagatose/L-ribulose 3-epimerase
LPEDQRQAEWQLAVAGVRQACEAAAARKLRIAIEPLNRFETDLVHTAADAVRMARDVAHPAAGVMIDSFHMTIEEDSLEQAVLTAGPHLIHVQVSENQRGIPGTGLTDWAALAAGLRTIGYRGMVIIESFTPDNRDLAGAVCIWKRRAPDQDTFAREGLRFLQQQFSWFPSS